ncbi:MAG TPA: phosphotransferase [Mycobacteriales bacterium]|nr:phosphotransferase [Mycobacteriales bacterium]
MRPRYETLPGTVRSWVDEQLGSAIVSAATQGAGFSPGVAARVITAAGQRAFVKAIASSIHAATATLHRQEITALEGIPPTEFVPRLYATYDDGDWVALLMEDVDGRNPDPWTPKHAALVPAAVDELTATFTPTPWNDARALEDAERVRTNWWQQVLDLPGGRLPELIAMHEVVAPSVRGETLCLRDMTLDNILVTDAGRVFFVDWAWASRAAAWVDTMHLACDVVGTGGAPSDADAVLAEGRHSRHTDPAVLNAYLANLAGSAYVKARRTEAPELAPLQAWRRSRADRLVRWLWQRAGW